MQPNTRIAVNTAVIYIRLLITIFVSLFSTRYVLLALGESNFGIYNLIAGVVALFSFISATMAGTTQRFISFSMGQNDINRVNRVFYNSCIIHIGIAIIIVLLVETAGVFIVNNILDIPIDKLNDAKFVLHCVTLGLVFTVLSVPFEATLMAHENILFVSIITIFNSLVKFIGAVVLLYISINKLRLYAILMALLPLVCLISQYMYCRLRYKETKTKNSVFDYTLIKEMGGYAGWVLIGITCGTIRTQGTTMLLNIFWGVIANAANGIAIQVNGVLQQFSTSITTSIRPQLVKCAGENNRQRMLTLTYAACKYPSLLLSLFAIPLIIAMPYVLELWLKEVPENTTIFCRITLFTMLFNQLTMGLTTAIEAIGQVRKLHLIVGAMHIISIPVAYILYKLGFPVQTIFWCILAEEVVAALFRVILTKNIIFIEIKSYLKQVLIKVLFVISIVSFIGYILWGEVLVPNVYNLILFCLCCGIIFILAVFMGGLSSAERTMIYKLIHKGYNIVKS